MFKQSILAATVSLLGMAGVTVAAPNWPNVPYSYYAREQSLQHTLREFAGGFSLALQMTPKVTGMVNGKFNASSPTEFLDRLGGVYGFNWFVYAGTLFISRTSDMETRSINAMGISISALREALQQVGVLDARFGWGELPDQDVALVSGPPAYVDLVQRTVAALPSGTGGQQVVVFKLKHASVGDRTITYRNQQVVTPGLATVLRNLISGNGSGANNQTLAAIAAPLRDNPPAFASPDASGTGQNSGGTASVAPSANGNGNGNGTVKAGPGLRSREPTVEADARLNAIIVQDIPDRIPIYRSLIEQLDLPSTLVEIEAMIVDVNSNLINELGITWGAIAGTASFGYGNLALAPSNGLPVQSGADLSPGTLGVSVGNNLVARMRALQTKGQANILSQPSILTTDNLGAMIDLSDTFYIQTRGERVASVTPVTVGTSLRVTPRHIPAPEGARIELTVDIEDGRIQEERQIDNLPTVRKSNISTLAVVGNDQTLLIGGYNSSQDSEQVDKVPVLGDIPGLGMFFSNRSKTVQRRERLFLIRPRLIAINGEVVSQNRVLEPTAAVNATWGGKDSQLSAGQYLDLIQGQRTRVAFKQGAQPQRTGPIRAADWVETDVISAPVLQGKSSLQEERATVEVIPAARP